MLNYSEARSSHNSVPFRWHQPPLQRCRRHRRCRAAAREAMSSDQISLKLFPDTRRAVATIVNRTQHDALSHTHTPQPHIDCGICSQLKAAAGHRRTMQNARAASNRPAMCIITVASVGHKTASGRHASHAARHTQNANRRTRHGHPSHPAEDGYDDGATTTTTATTTSENTSMRCTWNSQAHRNARSHYKMHLCACVCIRERTTLELTCGVRA